MPSRDILRFVFTALGVSILLALGLWVAATSSVLATGSGLTVVPVAGVILAARGVAWRRRLAFAGGLLGSFLLADAFLEWAGFKAFALSAPTIEPVIGTALYMDLALAMPLAVLFVFVGRTPSVLWTPPPAEAKTGARRRQ